MGRQHQRLHWPRMEYHSTESLELRGVEEAGCKTYKWCPNGQPDYGTDEGNEDLSAGLRGDTVVNSGPTLWLDMEHFSVS